MLCSRAGRGGPCSLEAAAHERSRSSRCRLPAVGRCAARRGQPPRALRELELGVLAYLAGAGAGAAAAAVLVAAGAGAGEAAVAAVVVEAVVAGAVVVVAVAGLAVAVAPGASERAADHITTRIFLRRSEGARKKKIIIGREPLHITRGIKAQGVPAAAVGAEAAGAAAAGAVPLVVAVVAVAAAAGAVAVAVAGLGCAAAVVAVGVVVAAAGVAAGVAAAAEVEEERCVRRVTRRHFQFSIK